MNSKLKFFVFFLVGVLFGIGAMSIFKTEKPETTETVIHPTSSTDNSSVNVNQESSNATLEIDDLTSEKIVVNYLKTNNKLPDYYITKNEARNSGWEASKGNLCDVLQGKAIGGDRFSNREKKLPTQKGRQYYEADLNYDCGRRNADRVVYSNDGLIFVTKDHYKTFKQQ